MNGQRYLGLSELPIDQLNESQGRYRDFNFAFLPKQIRTKERWKSIDKAHLEQNFIPSVDLYKIGDVYLVIEGTIEFT